MKIAILTSVGAMLDAFFPPIVAQWRQNGHEVVVAASTPSEIGPHTKIKSLTRTPHPQNVHVPRQISRWLKREKVDVLVTNSAVASLLARATEQPCPVVYFCHGLHWDKGTSTIDRLWQTLEQFALRRTAGVITINSDDQSWFESRVADCPITRLDVGVGLPLDNYPRAELPPLTDGAHLLWAGEFSDRKRPWAAIEVMHHLRNTVPKARLTMCGDGPLLAEVKELVSDLGLNDSVSLQGRVSNIAERLTESHALVMTSRWEGLPRIGLEAIAVGRPVFAFDVKGVRSLPMVTLAHDGNPEFLARSLTHAIANEFEQSATFLRKNLDTSKAAEEILAFLECVIIAKVSTNVKKPRP